MFPPTEETVEQGSVSTTLTVAMITLDEEGAVEKVIRSIQAVVPDAEILLVDSSKDATPQIAESLGARVIRQFPPSGYGPAMSLALRSAAGDVTDVHRTASRLRITRPSRIHANRIIAAGY